MKCYSKITHDNLTEAAKNMSRAARQEYVDSRGGEAKPKAPDNAETNRYAGRDEFLNRRYES